MYSTPMPKDGNNIVSKSFRVRVRGRHSHAHYEIVSS